MIKYYAACRGLNNFGDELTPYIIKHFGYEAEFTHKKEDHVFMSGSILWEAQSNTTVLGAGFGSSNQKIEGGQNPVIKLVRGPLTENIINRQGFNTERLFGDPGLILPHIYLPSKEKSYGLGIIPHYIDKNVESIANFSSERESILVIDIQKDINVVIDQILECEMTISSSLHGLIASHVYGVPSLWVEFSDGVLGDGFKFRDYFASVWMDKYEPVDCRDSIPSDIQSMIPDDTVEMDSTRDLYYFIEKELNERRSTIT